MATNQNNIQCTPQNEWFHTKICYQFCLSVGTPLIEQSPSIFITVAIFPNQTNQLHTVYTYTVYHTPIYSHPQKEIEQLSAHPK
jgi:hypothetical protein